MTPDRHLTWENFERDILRAGVPADHRIAGKPAISLYFRPNPSEIGIAIDLPSVRSLRPSPFREIEFQIQSSATGPQLRVSTTNSSLFRQLFPVLLEVADAVQIDGGDPVTEAEAAIRRIGNAIRLVPELSIERIIGLWGELWVLRHLLIAKGPAGIGCWNGWMRDRHDFRVDAMEMEVKTALGQTAVHTVNGVGQLKESDGHALYVLSILLSRSERGTTLADSVGVIRSLLSKASSEAETFEAALRRLGVGALELDTASDAFIVRRPPALIANNRDVPCLTTDALSQVLEDAALGRLVDVSYQVNFEGMGMSVNTEAFSKIAPWMSSADV